jgi:uncharacterized protein YifN (PemK superfamily)
VKKYLDQEVDPIIIDIIIIIAQNIKEEALARTVVKMNTEERDTYKIKRDMIIDIREEMNTMIVFKISILENIKEEMIEIISTMMREKIIEVIKIIIIEKKIIKNNMIITIIKIQDIKEIALKMLIINQK